MKTKELCESYVTPKIKDVEVNASVIICVSGGTESGTDGEGSGSDVDFGGGV